MKYIISEKQDINSFREGEVINAKNLTQAKHIASKLQFFKGTVLTIRNRDGALLAYKRAEKWINC